MRIYTRSGDDGTTSLIYGERVAKNDLRVEAYGTCDEANAMIGFALSHLNENLKWSIKERKAFHESAEMVQNLLFHVGSELATPKGKSVAWPISENHIKVLEEKIDEWDSQLEPLKQFILPSGHPAASALHNARTIVRRAERLAVGLNEVTSASVLIYLNRLSDYLFVAARYVNHFSSYEETTLKAQI